MLTYITINYLHIVHPEKIEKKWQRVLIQRIQPWFINDTGPLGHWALSQVSSLPPALTMKKHSDIHQPVGQAILLMLRPRNFCGFISQKLAWGLGMIKHQFGEKNHHCWGIIVCSYDQHKILYFNHRFFNLHPQARRRLTKLLRLPKRSLKLRSGDRSRTS